MAATAIDVEGISKTYRLGGQQLPYGTLRDTLVNALRTWFSPSRDEASAQAQPFFALKDVSFAVRPGEVIGIIGRNGAGKSTLLKIISRITEPTTGRVRIRGRVASLLEVGTGFHAELSGRENLYLNGAILGMTRREIDRKFDEIVEFAEVGKFIDTPVKRYSSGLYLRLAFAIAAHLEPEILIVDEVLAVGDATFQQKCLGKMQDVAGQGRTVLFVSHNMAAVTKLCQRAIWLRDGRVFADGPSATVVREYLRVGSVDGDVGALWLPQKPQSADLPVTLERALVRTDGSGPVVDIPFDSSISVDIEYSISTPIRGMAVVCRVTDQYGNILFTSSDTDGGTRPPDPRAAGRYVSACPLPRSLLRPGNYSVTIGISQYGRGWLHYEEDALAFRVTPQGYSLNNDRQGLLTPVIDWDFSPARPTAPH